MRWLPVLLLCGCAHSGTCPPLKEYPEEFSARLAAEIQQMEASATVEAVTDYLVLRRQVKACGR